MQLLDILKDACETDFSEFAELQISSICRDSSKVENGDVYFCLTTDFDKACKRCYEASKNGAAFVISQFEIPNLKSLKVNDVRACFGKACANFYGRACDELTIIGVTGTNGKTTVSHVVSQMLTRNGKKVGIIGTNGVYYNGKTFPCPLTTPDADFLHKTFKEMKEDGVEYVVMEVSAHAIDQKRVSGIKFEIGVLTNITQDHLDYFHTIEEYEKTKLSFFCEENVKFAIVYADDERTNKLIKASPLPMWTYGLNSPSDAFAVDVLCTMDGTRFVGNINDSVVEIKTNLIGNYNVLNCLAALCVCQKLGLNDKALTRGLNFINPVEGRFNVINFKGKYVVIDFAHSPDGLKNVLSASRELTDKKVYVIFGCGGNRDKDKRHKMGKIAEEYADYVCLTDDNPRLEKSLDIIADIEQGMSKPHFVETDRTKAIEKMISVATAGDVIVIAGKGAEKYQEVGTTKFDYNDFDAVLNIFKKFDSHGDIGSEYGC